MTDITNDFICTYFGIPGGGGRGDKSGGLKREEDINNFREWATSALQKPSLSKWG